jgi:lysophospholipase L1-like esterase
VVAELRHRHDRVRFTMLACSGALAAGEAVGLRSLSRQVDAVLARRSQRPALVTLTVGINDFGWSDVVATYFRLRDPDTAAFESWVASTVERAVGALRAQVSRLLRRPKLVVVLTEYPNPVNTASLLFFGPAPCEVTVCYARTELVVHELNEALAGLARKRVRIAAVHDAFHGHEAPSPSCGDAPPGVEDTWFQYPEDPDSNSFPALPPFVPSVWRGDCFHPNGPGSEAIAAAVDAAAKALGR